jgi:hypothetical protein
LEKEFIGLIMPSGVYKRTLEHNAAISVAKKGSRHSEAHKANIAGALKGRSRADLGHDIINCMCGVCKLRRGIPQSEEIRRKIVSANVGKKRSIESKMKMSAVKKGRSLVDLGHKLKCTCSVCKASRGECFGSNNNNWSEEPKIYPSEFNEELKESIRERDGRVCQMFGCGKTEEENYQKLDVRIIVMRLI